MDKLARIRKELDEAITHGCIRRARRLIGEGLHESRNGELLAELEYFKGQEGILNENWLEAIKHFDRAIKFNPKDGASFNDRALCLIELGRIEEAFDYFDRGIEAEPDYATIYHNKGWLLNKIGRHKEAIKYFNKALELEADRAVTYENLGDALARLGKDRDALQAYKKAIHFLKPIYSSIKKQLIAQMRRIEQGLKKYKVN